ncbi:FitA-like ribbon-helix-helix domain-containing protein [Serinicoccus hydrothermalis]|uniref:FitA-like ribbon-helix-helix domain-containing protein n=1 Tax=Serinicoccus hydrothermalis TaxID=1758689 RepID=UPI00082FB229|nr:antitoxin [Serinicoccus hydrothermalis]
MTTLYVRDVPEDVADTLKRRAAEEGKSLSAYVVGELGRIAARPTNGEIVERLRRVDRRDGPTGAEITDALQQARR